MHIEAAGLQGHFATLPAHHPCAGGGDGVLGDVEDVRELVVHSITLRLLGDSRAQELQSICEGVGLNFLDGVVMVIRPLHTVVLVEIGSPADAGEGQRATSVLFLRAGQITSKAELCLYLFLAIAEVVVCNHCNEETIMSPHADLESLAVVVLLVGVVPGHAVPALSVGGGIPVGQTNFLLCHLQHLGGENHAARVPAPMLDV
mmetsp:Transcript_80620/g.168057  ORF Transcript_80620/g.168057 Transcript_80620/m.168057 type:complete len:203 (+) Transcript_80620:2493-3101(+)